MSDEDATVDTWRGIQAQPVYRNNSHDNSDEQTTQQLHTNKESEMAKHKNVTNGVNGKTDNNLKPGVDPNDTTRLAKHDIEASVTAAQQTVVTKVPVGLEQPTETEEKTDPRLTATVGADESIRAPADIAALLGNIAENNDAALPAPIIPPVSFPASQTPGDGTVKMSKAAILEAENRELIAKAQRLKEEKARLEGANLNLGAEIENLTKKIEASKKREGAMFSLLYQQAEDEITEEFGDERQKELAITDMVEKTIINQLTGGATMQIESRRKKQVDHSLPTPQKSVWLRSFMIGGLMSLLVLLTYNYAIQIKAFLGLQ